MVLVYIYQDGIDDTCCSHDNLLNQVYFTVSLKVLTLTVE